LWHAYQRSYEHLGNDPAVGRRLVSLLVQAGAAPVRNTFIFFGSCAGEPHFANYAENLIGILKGARHTVVGAELMSGPVFDAALLTLREWSRDRAATLWYAVSWAEGRRV
jgi:hypothetical protein